MKVRKDKQARGGNPSFRGKARRVQPKTQTLQQGETDIPKRWVWHFETLSCLREQLIQERRERLTEVAGPIEAHSLSPADSASDEFDHALALSRLSVDQDALYEVEAAMKRILDGKYGICEQSGREIPAARLKVLPWTRYRKEVANRLERTGVISPSQLGRIGSRENADSDGQE